MKTVEGHFFDGLQPVGVSAKMNFSGPNAALTAGTLSASYANSQLKVSPRIAVTERFISLPDGTQFLCADQTFLDTLPQESPSEGVVAWLESRWQVAIACIAAIIMTLLLGYFLGLPILAERLANHMPMTTEQVIGEQALKFFDEREWLGPSALNETTQVKILDGFNILHSDLPFREFYRLEFRSGQRILGANAMALPGGIIVITDELIEIADTVEEVLAVLAHEIGHVELRHSMRGILQDSIVAAAVAALTSDAATLNVAVAGLPAVLASTKYSREFETAADDYAFSLLKRNDYSPAAFASIIDKLAAESAKSSKNFGYFSTHPLKEERVEQALEATENNATEP